MTLKDQLRTIKENWLLAAVLLILVLLPFFSGSLGTFSTVGSSGSYRGEYSQSEMALEKSYPSALRSPFYGGSDFAPEITDRLLTKTAYLSSKTERGAFFAADQEVKNMVTATEAFLLNANVQKYGEGRTSYYTGYYQIKVETAKYPTLVSRLKELGEIQSFSESVEDITGRHTDLEKEIEKEEERLRRYEQMYAEATEVADKIQLSNLIFDQERLIDSLKDYLENLDNQVDYSTVSVTLTEEPSGYAGLAFAKLSEIVTRLVSSINGLLYLVAWALPYALAVLVVWLGVKKFRKKKK